MSHRGRGDAAHGVGPCRRAGGRAGPERCRLLHKRACIPVDDGTGGALPVCAPGYLEAADGFFQVGLPVFYLTSILMLVYHFSMKNWKVNANTCTTRST